VMLGSALARSYEAPGRGYNWGMATFHPTLPRGTRVATAQNGTLEEILVGPNTTGLGRSLAEAGLLDPAGAKALALRRRQ